MEGFTSASFDLSASVEPRVDHQPLIDIVQKATEECWAVFVKYNLRPLSEMPMVINELKKHSEHVQKAVTAKALGETEVTSV